MASRPRTLRTYQIDIIRELGPGGHSLPTGEAIRLVEANPRLVTSWFRKFKSPRVTAERLLELHRKTTTRPRRKLPMAVEILDDIYLPRGHSPGLRVPHGGSSCANCKFGDVKSNTCSEPNFVRWNGGPRVPVPLHSFCSDWWEPRRSV